MVRTTTLDRVIALLDDPPAEPDTRHGYLDLLGGEPVGEHDTIAQRLMRSSALPKIYEDVWRPVIFGLSKGGPFGPSTAEEYALAREWLGLSETPGAVVLDVACGPGNVTRALAAGVPDGGLVVGVDASATMLERAVAAERTRRRPGERTGEPAAGGGAEVVYVRGDAVRLPFRDDAFDAVCCYGALYLFDDPWAAIDGMARVLKPGGRIAFLTTRRPAAPLLGHAIGTISRIGGIRMFGTRETSAALSARGFTAVHRRSYGLMQFVGGTLAC